MQSTAKKYSVIILCLSWLVQIGLNTAADLKQLDPTLVELEELQGLISTDPLSALPRIRRILAEAIKNENIPHQIEAHLALCSFYLQLEQSADATTHCEQSRDLAISIDNNTSLSESLMILATVHSQKAQFDTALRLLNESETIALKTGDSFVISGVYILRGRFYVERSMSEAALEDLLAAYEIHDEAKDKRRFRLILSEIAKVYDMLEEYEKSIEYALKAIDILDKDTERMSLSIAYYNIGRIYRNANNLEKTEEYMRKALSISEELNDNTGIAYAQVYIAWVLEKRGLLNEAESLYTSAIKEFETQNNARMLFVSLTNLAELRLQSNSTDNAIRTLNRANHYAKKTNVDTDWFRLHEIYAKAFLKNKNMDEYSNHIQKQIQYKENIYKAEKEIVSKNLQTRFDIIQAETDNLLLKTKNELQASQIERAAKEQQSLFYALGLAFLSVAIIVYMLFKQISAREKYKRLALRDELTGAPNRRAILEFAKHHIQQSLNTNDDFTVAIVDLDEFKNINDRFGHDVGDEVLKAFSGACQDSLRNQDKYGRIGGEEWLIVFPATDTSHIESIFLRIREKLAEKSIKGIPDNVEITFSLGATQSVSKNLNSLLKIADKHLYLAKQKGRNCFSY